MIIKELNQETIVAAVEVAGRAPSMHNSQPWRFGVGARQVDLYADYSRWLPVTDTDARDLILSCGAALHHLELALAAAGVHAKVHRLPSPQNPELLATLTLDKHVFDEVPGAQLFPYITARRTDRRPFGNWPIPEAFIAQLADRAAEHGALLRVVDDDRAHEVLTRAITLAAHTQDQTPGYNAELASWSGREGADGIPRANLLQEASATVVAARTFAPGDLPTPADGDAETSTLLVLGTTSGDRLSQLRAGEALSAVLLQATEFGLASCPLTQPLEVEATRKLLEADVLGGTLSPQVVVRIGWAPVDSPLPATPRRSVDELVEYLPA